MRNSFKDMTFEELVGKRTELQRKYLDLRVNKVLEHINNPLEIRVVRRQIARLNTLIYNHKDVAE